MVSLLRLPEIFAFVTGKLFSETLAVKSGLMPMQYPLLGIVVTISCSLSSRA
ncbi:Uncharacterised protein [Yersinia enterocolitica]|nr:Uncharacterised protein [Yersinia enterocolitica]CRX74596.1 Uncharacterised protein [Yersinia enterocolitica]